MASEENMNPAAGAPARQFRKPQPKPGVNVAPLSLLRRIRRSVGGTVAYLASWWRY
jgi:hypothetical protein